MSLLIGLLLLLARLVGLPHEVFDDGSGYVDFVPPSETRWCGVSWGAFDSPDDGFAIGCFDYPEPELPLA